MMYKTNPLRWRKRFAVIPIYMGEERWLWWQWYEWRWISRHAHYRVQAVVKGELVHYEGLSDNLSMYP